MFYYGCSTLGGAEPLNQDIYGVYQSSEGLTIMVLADGVSGAPAGEVAAQLAVEMFAQIIERREKESPISHVIVRAVQAANDWVRLNASRPPGKNGMATCFTAAAVTPDRQLSIVHVGSSRFYIIRDGLMLQLTEDHTRAWQEMRQGLFTRRQIRYHPDRLVLTRALGIWEEVEIDTLEAQVHPGDILLLVSDGITEALDDDALRDTVLAAGGTQKAVEALLDAADAARSGNATAIVGYIPPDGRPAGR